MDTAEKIFTTDGSNNFANGALMGASLNKSTNDPALMAAMMNGWRENTRLAGKQ